MDIRKARELHQITHQDRQPQQQEASSSESDPISLALEEVVSTQEEFVREERVTRELYVQSAQTSYLAEGTPKQPKEDRTITFDQEKWAFYYEQACEARRLYSIHVKDIRTVSIVQGIALLGGVVYLDGQHFYHEAIAGIVLGFFLTLTLWSMHKVYFDHSMEMQNYISIVLENKNGPWTNHIKSRNKRLNGKIRYGLFQHGVFLLLLLSLTTIAVITVLELRK